MAKGGKGDSKEKSMAATWGGKEAVDVILVSEDGKSFRVSEEEAINCGKTVYAMIKYDSESITIPSAHGEIKCCVVRLSVKGDTLSKVIALSNKSHFKGLQDTAVMFDLILAADYLRNQQLLELTCNAIAIEFESMTPGQILTLEQNDLKALHIVRCQRFTAYDPKRNDFICTRFCGYNMASFDLDQESRLNRGPPLDKSNGLISKMSVESAVNVISLKVTESDVGKKLCLFGTVVARDQVDYKCLYLFKRGVADAQTITLPDGMLTLTDPCRGLVLSDEVIFELDLKIKCDGGSVEDFSRGVISMERARLPTDKQTVKLGLSSWLSRVEMTCLHVVEPVEATIAINVLKGPCNLSRVDSWTVGNHEDCIILYGSEADGAGTVIGNGGGWVPLSRRVVAVPLEKKLMLHIVGDGNIEHLFVTLPQLDDRLVCKMGSAELEITIAWTSIPKRREFSLVFIGDECLLC